MGLSDIPPPTPLCLKRSRSEDPPSLSQLCSPLPKQPCLPSPALCTPPASHHLSLLADLESSLDSSAVEAPTPEELVMEMMQNLKRVMGDIGELAFVSGEGPPCVQTPITIADPPRSHDSTADMGSEFAECELTPVFDDSILYVGTTSSRDLTSEFSECDLAAVSDERTLYVGTTSSRDLASEFAECDLAAVSDDRTLYFETTNSITNSPQRFNTVRDMPTECEVASEAESYARRDSSDAGNEECGNLDDSSLYAWDGGYGEGASLEDGCDGGTVSLDNMQHLLDMSDDELGISEARTVQSAPCTSEVRDEQWTLLDDFAGPDARNDSLISCCAFLEEGYGVSSFTLSQDEDGKLARAREQGELDCYL